MFDSTRLEIYKGIICTDSCFTLLLLLLLLLLLRIIIIIIIVSSDRLCGLVVRVLDYRFRGPGFDSQALQKK
jgi:hypothetical protein